MKAFHGNQGTISPDMLECKRLRDTKTDLNETPFPGYNLKVDVYSLGIVFFWLVCGETPFNRKECETDTELA